VQRGHHPTPSFTAFQLIEQIFECLKTQEADAQLAPSPASPPSQPPPSPPRRAASPRRRSPSPGPASRAVVTEGLPPQQQPSTGGRRRGRGEGGLRTGSFDGGVSFFSAGEGSNSEEDFHPLREGQGGTGEGGREAGEGGTAARFSTEWAYRLAVTKLTAQLKATRERLRGEKEAAKSAGERAEQARRAEFFVKSMHGRVRGRERPST